MGYQILSLTNSPFLIVKNSLALCETQTSLRKKAWNLRRNGKSMNVRAKDKKSQYFFLRVGKISGTYLGVQDNTTKESVLAFLRKQQSCSKLHRWPFFCTWIRT